MSPLETLLTALSALARNRMRSALTALGIIIGVAAVIAMVAIGSGARARVEAAFSAMGTNLLVVLSGSSRAGGQRGGFGSQPSLTWGDLKAIQVLEPVLAAAPQLRSNQSLVAEGANWTTSLIGTTPDHFLIRDWPAEEGELFTQADVDASRKVVVLGATAAQNLFGDSAAAGQVVRIRNTPFSVMGVLRRKGQSASGQDYDDAAFVPVSAFRSKVESGLPQFISGSINVRAADGRLEEAQAAIGEVLRARHRLGASKEDDFSIRNLTETAEAQQDSTRTMTSLLAAVAGVSLLVGGIGVMNIMLVSVTERTREIGLRLALGARQRDVLAQFLAEAALLSMLGGALGVALGIASAAYLARSFGWALLVSPAVAGAAVGFSALIGIAFGLYPALRAALLDPIEALRHE
ncbi:MAG TPA: ABC transporter permease [Solimonas sp.]|nr:ABC transporter permease [Solimonas sp.]